MLRDVEYLVGGWHEASLKVTTPGLLHYGIVAGTLRYELDLDSKVSVAKVGEARHAQPDHGAKAHHGVRIG